MQKTYSLYMLMLLPIAINTMSHQAHAAANLNTYANYVTANNIHNIHHAITSNAIETYEGELNTKIRHDISHPAPRPRIQQPSASEYGKFPIYGEMLTYGEYNDDGSATLKARGHNGGDTNTVNNSYSVWANWQHFVEDTKFDHTSPIDTKYDIVTLGLTGGHINLSQGQFQWGTFGGYVGGTQELATTENSEHGGYIGLYSGYKFNQFNISAILDSGKMYNSLKDSSQTITDFKNAWAGATLHTAYNIALDRTFSIQPELYIGYTWVKSDNFKTNLDIINNKNMSNTYVTPGLRAIKHIISDWYGSIGIKHSINHYHGGQVYANDIELTNLETKDFTEYGIALEKSIDSLYINLHINRRDGSRTGWNGGTSFKYIF